MMVAAIWLYAGGAKGGDFRLQTGAGRHYAAAAGGKDG
jgi:hypothetical protein